MIAKEIFSLLTPTEVSTFNMVYGWNGHWIKVDINK